MRMTFGQILRRSALQQPDKPAVLQEDRSITFAELDHSTDCLAAWLLDQGLKQGDRAAIHWSNSIEAVQLFFAMFKAGVIAVPVNLRLKAAEISYVLEHSGAALCFSEPALARHAQEVAHGKVLTELPSLPAAAALPEIDPAQACMILYTSGTTARPKGVVHTHNSILRAVPMMAREFFDSETVALATTPLMHAAAILAVMAPAVYTGASMVVLPAFSPAGVLNAIQRFRVTFTASMPALMQMMVEEQERNPRDVSSLRAAGAGGDAVSLALQTRFLNAFGIPLREGYAMTESFPIAFNLGARNRQGAMGPAFDGVEVRIEAPDGRELPNGEIGEIAVRSPGNCLEYWNNPEATADLMRGGWLHTGDLGYRDQDNFLWFKGRLKQIIIRAGSNISPQEVEEALYHHPAVAEVGVVGEADPLYGERVAAFVVLRAAGTLTAEQLRDHARERLADYKVPERILFVASLPKGLTGKVDRRALKESLAADQSAAASG
jgi:long-chain acyl-CoA synthetase